MKITQIVFSPTGGTQKVIDILCSAWNLPTSTVDLTRPDLDFSTSQINPEDLIVIAIPSYAGRVPTLAANRLKQIQGDHAKCVLVCVYGNRAYEDTLIELFDLTKELNFEAIAAITAIAKHSIMNQFATNRPDSNDIKELQTFAHHIMDKLKSKNDDLTLKQVPGNHPYKPVKGGGIVPFASDECIECGHCVSLCPAQAISHTSAKRIDPSLCISCMRCVSVCPLQARHIDQEKLNQLISKVKEAISSRKDNELFI